jgi:hypothetical protein
MAHLGDITKGATLKHVDTVDKSAPVIEADVKVQPNKHNDVSQPPEHAWQAVSAPLAQASLCRPSSADAEGD